MPDVSLYRTYFLCCLNFYFLKNTLADTNTYSRKVVLNNINLWYIFIDPWEKIHKQMSHDIPESMLITLLLYTGILNCVMCGRSLSHLYINSPQPGIFLVKSIHVTHNHFNFEGVFSLFIWTIINDFKYF